MNEAYCIKHFKCSGRVERHLKIGCPLSFTINWGLIWEAEKS